MSNSVHLSPKQQEALLKALGQELHTDPGLLLRQIQARDFQGLSQSMGIDIQRQLQDMMKNPEQLQQMMNSPQMKQVLSELQKK